MQVGPPSAPVPPPYPARRNTGPWPVVAASVTGVWAVLVTVPAQLVGWVVDQLVLVTGLDRRVAVWPVVALVTVLLVGAPTLALALVPRSPAIRATGRAWLAGTLALGALT
ncbi:S8 family serine peptidase, partial [Micromonospora sp. I033]